MNQGLHAKFLFNIASLDQYCLTTLTFKLNIKNKSYINSSKVISLFFANIELNE